jgi:hypothetical protein
MKNGILIFLLLIEVSLAAQDPVALAEEPGTWKYAYLNDANTRMYSQNFAMSAKEVVDFKGKMDQLVEVLHRNPVMANPRGFDADVESRPFYPYDFKKHPENYGYVGEINFRLPQWFNSKGKKYKQTIEPPRTTVYLNHISLLGHSAFSVVSVGNNDEAADRVNDICRPMVIKELQPGVILFDYAIVFSKPGKSLFLPCTVGEAYKRLIAYYESANKIEPYYDMLLNPLTEEYARLTAGQLGSPAYFGGMTGITYEKTSDPLMLVNNNFFDRSKPKTAVQAIVFPINADYFRETTDFVPSDVGFYRINQFLHSLDIKAIMEIVE